MPPPAKVITAYSNELDSCFKYELIAGGLINETWKCCRVPRDGGGQEWILQRINQHVFTRPWDIARNIELAQQAIAKASLQEKNTVELLCPVPNAHGKVLTCTEEEEYWRLIPYARDSITIGVLSSPQQAKEAAQQFGRLRRSLHNANIGDYAYPLKNFHDLELYFELFREAVLRSAGGEEGDNEGIVEGLIRHEHLVDQFRKMRATLPLRIMHHDTKLSNVLFHEEQGEGGRGLCPIDLDTLMPGLVISDVGDMVRTYVCGVTEDEPDVEKIRAAMNSSSNSDGDGEASSDAYFRAIIEGYLSAAGSVLTEVELDEDTLLFAGPFMIMMQALRFATDWLKGNVYYQVSYQEQNLDRARNQITLLTLVLERKEQWRQIIRAVLREQGLLGER